MKRLLFLTFTVSLLAGGCGRELAPPPVNQPPETSVQADPPVSTPQGRSVWVYFSGEDFDGDVVAYEWAMAVAGASHDDLAWTRTVEAAVEIVFSPADLEQSDADALQRTILARAVDDDGAVDATPATVSFSPITLSPEVVITLPDNGPGLTCSQVTRDPVIGWTATDADSPGGAPEAVRILVLTVGGAGDPCLTAVDFELSNPFRTIATDDPRWSEWIPYDAQAGRLDPSRSLQLDAPDVSTKLLVAAQARDRDGAITKEFRWNQNVRHYQTTDALFPLLRVEEPDLGASTFVGPSGEKQYDVVAGQQLDFYLDSPPAPGIIVDAYRWGWNVIDPDDPNDPGWGVDWGTGDGWQDVPPRSFMQGSPNFVAQVRDITGTITRAVYQFQVIQLAPMEARRDVLLIDDFPLGNTAAEQLLEAQWDDWWNQRLQGVAAGFDAAQDVLDAQVDPASITLAKLLEYRAVVWFVSASEFSFLHSHLAPPSRTTPRYNWLAAYQRHGGNLLLVGPGAMYASIEHDVSWRYPIVFDTPDAGDLGFGTEPFEGSVVNRGTLRWPYRGFCLEAIDATRPPAGRIFGEAGPPLLRTTPCDAVYEAEVSPEFMGLAAGVVTLHPTVDREQLSPFYQPAFEEFYDVNVTSRDVDLVLRDCQVPMFLARTRGDAGFESSCGASPNGGAPIAIMSTAYADDKPGPGADFVWGFHPISFEAQDVEAALGWIVQENWQLAPAP